MIGIWVDRKENKIKIQTDDVSVRYFLEVTKRVTEYIPYIKSYKTITKTIKIYDKKQTHNGIIVYTLGLGWAGYIANSFSPYITRDEYNDIVSCVMSDTYRTQPFPELRDYQNDDVLHMLKYKIGLCGVYTSYGNKKKYLFMKRLIDADIIANKIYNNSTIYLSRKYLKFAELYRDI